VSAVIWHDLECGAYDVDLPLWRELADEHRGPIADVGAGTGRVALDLARRGREVIALDVDADLLNALHARAGGLTVTTLCADARDLVLDDPVELIIVPMQSIQLFGGAPGRARFLTAARAALAPGGVLALAIADTLEAVAGEVIDPPRPDICEIKGVVYSSRPVALRDTGDTVLIERVRETVDAAGVRTVDSDVIALDKLTADELEAQGRDAGLRVLPRREVPWSDEYIGSIVVMLGA
jgi:SAM-dependent methyltransferase